MRSSWLDVIQLAELGPGCEREQDKNCTGHLDARTSHEQHLSHSLSSLLGPDLIA
jgi:hypothetical protein